MKTMSVRLDDDLAGELEVIANAIACTHADLIRAALSAYIAARKKEPWVQQKLRDQADRYRNLVETPMSDRS